MATLFFQLLESKFWSSYWNKMKNKQTGQLQKVEPCCRTLLCSSSATKVSALLLVYPWLNGSFLQTQARKGDGIWVVARLLGTVPFTGIVKRLSIGKQTPLRLTYEESSGKWKAQIMKKGLIVFFIPSRKYICKFIKWNWNWKTMLSVP